MSTASLRELVETIKTRGTSLAAATGASSATPRDLVYLSTAVERLMGADALLELIDTAARPAEVILQPAPGTAVITLTTDQVQKEVIVVKPDTGTFTASFVSVIAPNRGWSSVVDNRLTIPLRVKTSTQSDYVQIAAGQRGWLYCDGTDVEFVVDIAAITAALTTPMTTNGDMVVFAAGAQARLGAGAEGSMLTIKSGAPSWQFSGAKPHTRIRALNNNYVGQNPDLSVNKGGKYTQSDGSQASTPTTISTVPTNRLGNYIEDATTFPVAANAGTWDVVQEPGYSYRGGSVVAFDGGFWVWGSPSNGRNGDISGTARIPVRPPLFNYTNEGIEFSEDEMFDIKQVVSAYEYTAVVTTDGTVYSCGYGVNGQQGDGGIVSRSFFRKVDFPIDAGPVRYLHVQFHGASTLSVYALMEDGDVYSWGYNNYGQLGHGDTTNRLTPTKITVFNQNVRCVRTGGYHVAFITNDNQLYLCGLNTSGQCGNGTVTNLSTPTLCNIGGAVVKVAICGDSANANGWTLALRADGRLYSFGYNGYGQLGDNSATSRSTPTQVNVIGVDTNKRVIDCWCGGGVYGSSAALCEDGTFYTWGRNNVGLLGLGDTTDRAVPVLNQKVQWVSDVQWAGQTTSTSYYYNNVIVMAHASKNDRINRRNGAAFTAGHQNVCLGRPNTASPQTQFGRVGFANRSGNHLRHISAQGYHSGATVENAWMALDEEGVVHWVGYDAGNYMSGRPDGANTYNAVQVLI